MDLDYYLFKNKIKREDFAKTIGINRRTLYHIIKGTGNSRISTVKKNCLGYEW
ncbi:MAG: helix-turn-helix domain-containing protein [Parachlamydiaceae bacterium]